MEEAAVEVAEDLAIEETTKALREEEEEEVAEVVEVAEAAEASRKMGKEEIERPTQESSTI